MTTEKLSHRPVESIDFETICQLPKNSEELFFMFPKAVYPLTVCQLKSAIENRFASTVILLRTQYEVRVYKEQIVGFANFYEVKENEFCSIGNVIVKSNLRNKGIGTFLIKTMENIGIEKYNVS